MKCGDAAYKLFFGSLANENRWKIINALKSKQRNVGEICKATSFEQTMVSHNLKRLERCGMVFAKQQGKHRYYSLNTKTIKPLLTLIDRHMKEYCAKIVEGKR